MTEKQVEKSMELIEDNLELLKDQFKLAVACHPKMHWINTSEHRQGIFTLFCMGWAAGVHQTINTISDHSMALLEMINRDLNGEKDN